MKAKHITVSDDAERNIVKGSLAILSGTIGAILISIITMPFIVRQIGPDGFGTFAIVLSVYSLLYAISDIGLSDSIKKHVAEKKNNLKIRSDIASISLLMLFLSGFLTLIIVNMLLYYFDNRIDASLILNLKIISIGLVFSKIFTASRSLTIGLQKEEKIEFLQPLNVLIFSVCAILLAYLGYGATGLIIAHVLGTSIIAIISLTIIKRYYILSISSLIMGYNTYKYKLLSYGFLALIIVLLMQSLYQADVLMIKYFMSDYDVGIYKAALLVSEYLWLAPAAIQMSLLSVSSELWSKQELVKLGQISSNLMKYTTVLLILLVSGLFVLAEPFIQIYYGNEFIGAALPLKILLIGSFGLALSRIMLPILQGKGELKLAIICIGMAALINIILNWIFIPIYGITGAAISTSTAYFSMIVSHSIAIKKIEIDIYQDFPIGKLSILLVVLLIPLTFVNAMINLFIANDLISLIIIPPLGLTIFLIGVIKLHLVPKSNIKKIIKFAHQFIGS